MASVCALLAGLAITACTSRRHPNVLLIVVDTMRADRLSATRDGVSLTPFLDELAARGCLFRRAYATSSWTAPSVASLFTSRYPSQHGVVGHGFPLAEAESTLAEVLVRNGYATAGFSANVLLQKRHGWGQGFQRYGAFVPTPGVNGGVAIPVRAETINEAALGWLDRRDAAKPFFLFLQYMEPHTPFAPPAWALERLGPAADDVPPVEHINAFARYGNLALEAVDDRMLAAIERYYDASVLALDTSLKALFDELQQRGLLADTLVVLTADHGEELKEHGIFGHGQTLYDTLLRVPLVVLPPEGSDHCEAIETPVSLLDLAPTITALVGLQTPRVFEGHSFAPAVSGTGDAEPARTIVSELLRPEGYPRIRRHVHALVDGDQKVIADMDGREEFYDLGRDPGEHDDGALPAPARDALNQQLADVVQKLSPDGATRPAPSLDEETRRNLEALGYLNERATPTTQP